MHDEKGNDTRIIPDANSYANSDAKITLNLRNPKETRENPKKKPNPRTHDRQHPELAVQSTRAVHQLAKPALPLPDVRIVKKRGDDDGPGAASSLVWSWLPVKFIEILELK